MSAAGPLVTAQVTSVRREMLELLPPGEPADGAVLHRLARELELIADLAALADRELALHRDLMDETHARKIAAALGAHEQPETMQ